MSVSTKWLRPLEYSNNPFSDNFSIKNPKNKVSNKSSCIKWVNSPTSVKNLIQTEDFINYLSTSIIFFHNKSPSCNDLILKRLNLVTKFWKIVKYNISNIDIDKFFYEITSTNKDLQIIYVITINNIRHNSIIFDFIINKRDRIKSAIWIKGYIEDTFKYIPYLFDGMFIFNTSNNEINLLRQKLNISDNTVNFLKENQNDFKTQESVLFYWNYENKSMAPLLYINPIVLGMGREIVYSNYSNLRENIIQEVTMGDKYEAGQVAAQGPNAHAHDITFNQVWQQNKGDLDLDKLKEELQTLRDEMTTNATNAEHYSEIGTIASAELEASKGNGEKALELLSNTGKWSLDTAKKVGIPVAVAAIKASLGI